MKSLLVTTVLLSLVMIGTSQPIEEASAVLNDVTAGLESSDDSAFVDMEGSESSLKVIEHKLEHWLKKYYKKTEKKDDGHSFGGYPGFPMIGYPSYPLIGYPLTYGYGLGGLNGLNLGLGGFGTGLGGYGTGLGLGYGTGLGYGYGTGLGYGGLGGFGYRR
ncbi:keratin-associated protein 21-1-like [Daphnia pulex]|uniref:keratin-associated protein 21-1-like n=1 Tax=Daphnia pulex TaxID=6669 RepID=UPI001EDE6423|nr:keratin-associated protein 21-1-like [Daphnia pulex]